MAAVIDALLARKDADAAAIQPLRDVAMKNWNGLEVDSLRASETSRAAFAA